MFFWIEFTRALPAVRLNATHSHVHMQSLIRILIPQQLQCILHSFIALNNYELDCSDAPAGCCQNNSNPDERLCSV